MKQVLKCAVLTKSNLKDTQRGKMFSMTLSDFNTTTTIRAICFQEQRYQEFNTTTTYDIQDFKVKKGFGASGLELLIAEDTKVTTSLFQYTVNKIWFKVHQIQRNETENIRFLNLKAKVLGVEDLQVVGQHPTRIDKREIRLADDTGEIILILWRERASSIDFKDGDTLKIENAVTSIFNIVRQLTTVPDTILTVINEDIGAIPATFNTKKRSYINTIETNITAFRNFKCLVRCFNCKKLIELNNTQFKATANNSFLINCTTCSTTFLSATSKIYNECQLHLAEINQWYTANSGVSSYLLIHLLYAHDYLALCFHLRKII